MSTFFPPSVPSSENATNNNNNKRKRRPAGTPDPDAEVVSLSPRTLLESDRYVCEICNQGFQRDQNLQMHRRRHKVPWKLVKRETSAASAAEIKKRVFVCPEPSCLHHDPSHALGDLVGIKKHFRRKHSDRKQWVCVRCSKGYAVQSDYKAHLKTCGTRGHSCDCGKVFSRVESFIEHQDTCNGVAGQAQPDQQLGCLSRTASSPSPSTDTNFSAAMTTRPMPSFLQPNLELQLLPTFTIPPHKITNTTTTSSTSDKADAVQLHLSLGPNEASNQPQLLGPLQLAMAEKNLADKARQQAKRQVELAEQELANAEKIRKQAQAELERAFLLEDHATKSINSILLQITCKECKQRLWPRTVAVPSGNNSVTAAASFMSSVVTEEVKCD